MMAKNTTTKHLNQNKMNAIRERRAKQLIKKFWIYKTDLYKRDFLFLKKMHNKSVNNEEGD